MLYPGSVTKSLLIEYLAEKASGNAKTLQTWVNQKSDRKITHQAVYKALKALQIEKIVCKERTGYALTWQYLLNMKRFNSFLSGRLGETHIREKLEQHS